MNSESTKTIAGTEAGTRGQRSPSRRSCVANGVTATLAPFTIPAHSPPGVLYSETV